MVFYAFSTKFTAAYKICSLAWGVRKKLGCVALFLLNYEIGASKGSELHESVVCRYILSTSSLLGLVPQETTFGVSSVDSYSAHPLVNLEKNLFHILGGTLDEYSYTHGCCVPGFSMQEHLPKVSTFPKLPQKKSKN